MKKLIFRTVLVCLALLWSPVAMAQLSGGAPIAYNYCYQGGGATSPANWVPCDAAHPLAVNANVTATATIQGFHTETVLAPITATTGGASSASFAAGKSVVVDNTGTTNTAFCQPGAAATASAKPILPGNWFEFTTTTETQITCATSASTTLLNLQVGTGVATGAGGSGSSGGGGGAVYGPTAVGSAAANPPVLFAGTANAAATGAVQVAKVDSSGNVYVDVTNTLAAGNTNADAVATGTSNASPVQGYGFVFNGATWDRQREGSQTGSALVTPSNQPVGAANLATNQISVGSTATSIVSARTGVSGTGRVSVTVCNNSTTPVYLGGSGVTTSTGIFLVGVAGACATLNTTAAVYGIVTTGTETVSFAETY